MAIGLIWRPDHIWANSGGYRSGSILGSLLSRGMLLVPLTKLLLMLLKLLLRLRMHKLVWWPIQLLPLRNVDHCRRLPAFRDLVRKLIVHYLRVRKILLHLLLVPLVGRVLQGAKALIASLRSNTALDSRSLHISWSIHARSFHARTLILIIDTYYFLNWLRLSLDQRNSSFFLLLLLACVGADLAGWWALLLLLCHCIISHI